MVDLRGCVVVPTYQRAEMVRVTLESLAGQRLPRGAFEVVVADDGSTDATAEVVRSFESRLDVGYHYQEDRGARAAAARNAGARLATAPVLIFLDAGVIAGPDLVGGHLQMHADRRHADRVHANGTRAAVIGYTHGYRPFDPTPGLAEAVRDCAPEAVRARYGDAESFQDCRHPEFASAGFEVSSLPLPWIMFWTVNASVAAEDFWRVGGFDEGFQGWGVEDLDLGFRLMKDGVILTLGREAWAIESPHERNPAEHAESVTSNALQLLGKFPEPALEFNWAWFATGQWLEEPNSGALHQQYRSFLEWTRKVAGLRVDGEVDAAVRRLPEGSTVAVFGCGESLPQSLPSGPVLDFDAEALARATGPEPGRAHHALGLRTMLPEQSVDLVVITSRLHGVWDRYGPLILAEAHRVGREVAVLADRAPETAG